MVSIIKSKNPLLILKELIPDTKAYKYKVELWIGGESGEEIEIGTPTISLQNTKDVRLLFPNEARLRNLTYASTVSANILVRITYTERDEGNLVVQDISPGPDTFQGVPIMKIPIMLHSSYCILHNKPASFLKEVGECPHDNGGYFIIEGSEKVLITKQEQAFNTLYITPKDQDPKDPQLKVFASISCLSPKTRQVKRVTFRLRKNGTILVGLPFVRFPVPLFILFRALGIQTDEEIVRLIYPDPTSSEAKIFEDKLQPSIVEAYPFLNTFTSIQYIKMLTKGFGEAHVIDILRNQTFTHMPNDPISQALFLAECVRSILRVHEKFDKPTDRDDIRNQRCLVSGFLTQQLFNNAYAKWLKSVSLVIGREHESNKDSLYLGERFRNIFDATNASKLFVQDGFITNMLMRGFKGKWDTGLGEEKAGVMQPLSRLSYCDFMSHCRRVVLEFDTSKKLVGPRRLHGSQYGYFCTSETPSGSSIGIAKNMSIMMGFSVASSTDLFLEWLKTKGGVYSCNLILPEQQNIYTPVFLNGGIIGFSAKAILLKQVLKLLKRTGCLPYSTSISLSITKRRLQIYLDDGRPIRPLLCCDNGTSASPDKIMSLKIWRDLVCGTLDLTRRVSLSRTTFVDPLPDTPLEDYDEGLSRFKGVIEYIDPYEQNEAFLVNFPEQVTPETTHVEIHPSTILSLMTTLIPFCHHNQSPRNQLGDSQSKQAVSMYATNWQNRFDNNAHVLCYGESHLVRSIYSNYLGEGQMPYGHNIILAIAFWGGYNQDDGIVFNYDAFQRGLFRSIAYRTYEIREEIDIQKKTTTVICNPKNKLEWTDLRPGVDYTKLDERGIIKEGEYCDEHTVIVGSYTVNETGQMKDSSLRPQVWTRGRVEKVVITVNNANQRLVKIRVVQDRIPELGDKFCLTPNHEVYTVQGWKPIQKITKEDLVAQLDRATGYVTYKTPTDVYAYDHEGEVLEILTEGGSQCVTMDHRLYLRHERENKPVLVSARMLYEGYRADEAIYVQSPNGEYPVTGIQHHPRNPYGNSVHCISVPTEIFLVRRRNTQDIYWTGNSNRHGQKGTIGALLRGHDMPRTKDGIIPDMIMNPHAIPSRMTIAQNLEQLFGKAVALAGSTGDGTAFMNDGSPEGPIGGLLEQMGYEKYGNEILYNGATGEQIPAAIFMGPVYGMRLKHMVEDKWQARGQGRKEQMTHQPTGGRGNQGGLKIGEMDRDAVIAHGISMFMQESFMKRSDGARVAVCTSCGTVPVYNPKLRITFCTMCNGPATYVGDSARNLELLPPMERQKGRIVEVEMPYATKIVTQEISSLMNIEMRIVTSADTGILRPFELSAKSANEVVLTPFITPELIEHERLEPTEEVGSAESSAATELSDAEFAAATASVQQLRASVAASEAATAAAERIYDDEDLAGDTLEERRAAITAARAGSSLGYSAVSGIRPPIGSGADYAAFQRRAAEGREAEAAEIAAEQAAAAAGIGSGNSDNEGPPGLLEPGEELGFGPQVPLSAQDVNTLPGGPPLVRRSSMNNLDGGGIYTGVGGAPTIVVATDPGSMAAQGLAPFLGRQPRQYNQGGGQRVIQQPQQQQQYQQYSGPQLVIKKLE